LRGDTFQERKGENQHRKSRKKNTGFGKLGPSVGHVKGEKDFDEESVTFQ